MWVLLSTILAGCVAVLRQLVLRPGLKVCQALRATLAANTLLPIGLVGPLLFYTNSIWSAQPVPFWLILAVVVTGHFKLPPGVLLRSIATLGQCRLALY